MQRPKRNFTMQPTNCFATKGSYFTREVLGALWLVAMLTGFAGAQVRSGGSPRTSTAVSSSQDEGQRQALRFWDKYVASCGGSHYVRKAPGIFVELKGFQSTMNYEAISQADRLNGVQAKGASRFTATAHRFYSNSRWQQWSDGIPDDMTLINSVRFQKVKGRWSFYGIGYFNDYAKPVSCGDVPGFRSEKLNEVPTNAIQINDTHNFPIQSFTFWDSSTNVTGDKFPRSTTTFINWRIIYTGTAFDYSLPPVQGYWIKDGVPWSEPNVAQFSNVGSGQLWAGKGWAEPGHWEVGSYTVKVYLRKQLIAQRSFAIVPDDALPGEIRSDGFYYRKDSDGSIWFLKFFDNKRVMEIATSPTNDFQSRIDDIWSCFNGYFYYGDPVNSGRCRDSSMGEGIFSTDGSQLNFQTHGIFGRQNGYRIDFSGSVTSTALKLEWKLNQTQSGDGTFTFVACPRNLKSRCMK
jgi:hypothetical protein